LSPVPKPEDPQAGIALVLGLGEIGRPLLDVLSRAHAAEGVDLPARDVRGPVEMMHVCYPGEIADFVAVTVAYAGRYHPQIIVIHSTVPVGTTRAVQAQLTQPVVHSPVRGKHVKMAQELTSYTKWVGSSDDQAAARVERHFEAAGMKTGRMQSSDATELAKLTETTYFGLLIAFAQDVDRMARRAGQSYDEIAAFYDEIGYLPPVKYFPGVIGGHCVMPNIALLKRTFGSRLLDAIEWSNELRHREAER
jgi:UDP-N-acetyl-D-mannosaminuronate dehydrogenase